MCTSKDCTCTLYMYVDLQEMRFVVSIFNLSFHSSFNFFSPSTFFCVPPPYTVFSRIDVPGVYLIEEFRRQALIRDPALNFSLWLSIYLNFSTLSILLVYLAGFGKGAESDNKLNRCPYW